MKIAKIIVFQAKVSQVVAMLKNMTGFYVLRGEITKKLQSSNTKTTI